MAAFDLEKQFHIAMIHLCDRSIKECNYNPSRFRQMVFEHRGQMAAKKLLSSGKPAEGLTRLWELGRLDLSVEAYVCQEKWMPLFTEPDIAIARKHLRDLGYPVSAKSG